VLVAYLFYFLILGYDATASSNLMMLEEEDIAKCYSREEADWI